ncbi:MAG: metal-dependent transcriptional regulator [Anaerolineales bacterium]|nr:metal-dependent transcriptional regulator [Anaerolineales bacterium]
MPFLVTALIVMVALLIGWPEVGLLARWQRVQHLAGRVMQEDALKYIHKCEMKGDLPTLEGVAGTLHIARNETAVLLDKMQQSDLLVMRDGQMQLTPDGRKTALHIIRAHRLWEHHLAQETGYAETEWHGQADRREHELSPEELSDLAARLGNPTHDPHGDPIPTAEGEVGQHGGRPLTEQPLDKALQIVHLEDEPDTVYAQLVAEGLYPGMRLRLIENGAQRVRFWANGDEHMLAPIIASNISVRTAPPETAHLHEDVRLLTEVVVGETAVVAQISPLCRGAERRRFMDLGILPGTVIKAEMRSPSGDPTAYRIRGAVIALRKEQSNMIYVKQKELVAAHA